MSHAHARFVFADGTVLHGEYDGTSDVMRPRIFGTEQEVEANWRRDYGWPGPPTRPEPCIVHCEYGGGDAWIGVACRESMQFVGPTSDEGAFVVPYRDRGKEFSEDIEREPWKTSVVATVAYCDGDFSKPNASPDAEGRG